MQFIITEKTEKYQKVYKVITPVAEMLWMGCAFAFDMYILEEDNKLTQVRDIYKIYKAIELGKEVVIEVGWIPNP